MKTIFDNIYVLHCLNDKKRDLSLQKKFEYLGLKYEYIYSLPLGDMFTNETTQNVFSITNKNNSWEYGPKNVQQWSVAFGHYMCVYQAYQLGYNNILIFEDDVVINNDKKLISKYLNNIPNDADIIRYGYMEWDNHNTDNFDNTNELFYKDNENNNFRYYGVQCYGIMNRKTMEIYLKSCNYIFHGNEDVENIFRKNEYNLNIYYATKPLFIDHLSYENIFNNGSYKEYVLPYSNDLMHKYTFIK